MSKWEELNRARITIGPYASDASDGFNGMFEFALPGIPQRIRCIASDGEGWQHVSVSFGGADQDIVSAEDGGDILTITNTDADQAASSIVLRLASNDATGDADVVLLRGTMDEDGTPTTEFNVAGTAASGGLTMT